jgi:AcrR family transcriptional regulator
MARTRTKPRAVRRQEILAAARSALKARGYHDVHLDDVADEAGLSKGTLYLYFKDKESLFAAALEEVIDRLQARLGALPADEAAAAALRTMAAELLDFVDEHQDFLIQFSREKPDLCGSRAGTVLQNRFNEHLRVIARLIERCIKERVVRDCDPMTGSLFFISIVRMFMLRRVMGLVKSPLRSHAEEFVELFLGGLGPRKASRRA